MAHLLIKKDPTSPGIGPGDRLVLTRSWGNWHLYRRRWLIWNTSGKPSLGGYDVDLWGINTHKALVDWLFHLGGKTIDPTDFFQAMQAVFRAAGSSDSFSGKDLALRYWQSSAAPPSYTHSNGFHKRNT